MKVKPLFSKAVLAWVAVFVVLLVMLPYAERTHSFVMVATGFWAAGTMVRSIFRYRPAAPMVWAAFAVTVVGVTMSVALRTLFPELIAPNGSAGIPDYVDVAWFAVLIAGLFQLARRRAHRNDSGDVIDSFVIAGGVLAFNWIYVVSPAIVDHRLASGGLAVGLSFSCLTVALMFCVTRLALGPRFHTVTARRLTTGGVIGLVAVLSQTGSLDAIGNEAVSGLIVAFLIVGRAAGHPSMATFAAAPEARSGLGAGRLSTARFIAMSIAILLAPATLIASLVQDSLGPWVIITQLLIWLTMTGFLQIRLAMVLRARTRAAHSERMVTKAAASLVVTSEVVTTYTATLDAGRRMLAESASQAKMFLVAPTSTPGRWSWGGAHPKDHALELAESDVIAAIAGDQGAKVFLQEAIFNIAANEGGAHSELVVVALRLQDRLTAALVIHTPRQLTDEALRGVESFASAAALAIEAAELAEDLNERRSEARFKSLVERSPDVIVVIDEDLATTFVSPVGRALFGAVGAKVSDYFSSVATDDRLALVALVTETIHGHSSRSVEFQVNRGGQILWFEASCNNSLEDEELSGVVLYARDITERKRFESDLHHQVLHDALTGIGNRTLFRERLDHALKLSSRRQEPDVAVMFIDLDDFKTVNDGLGHGAGDELLKVIAFRLQSHLRDHDLAARLGGDEFAVLLEDVGGIEEAQLVARRLLHAISEEISFGEHTMAVGASIGIAMATVDQTSEEVLRNADVAMYEAKQAGKHHCSVFDESMYERASSRLQVKSALDHALARHEMHVHYQPLMRMSDRSCIGFEALLRWEHPTLGMVPPDTFIPTAEDSGFIHDLGVFVLREALQQLKHWHKKFDDSIGINVNVSPLQLKDDRILTYVPAALKEFGIEPRLLTLELTESKDARDVATSGRLLELRSIGCRIAADDFGSGFASYVALQQLPFTDVKIDRSLITGLSEGSEQAKAQIRSIIKMGQSLGLSVTAEGIEDELQSEFLTAMDTDVGQGYLLGRPTTPEAAEAHLSNATLPCLPTS